MQYRITNRRIHLDRRKGERSTSMKLVSVRFITADIQRLVSFYGRVTGVTPAWSSEDFAEIVTSTGTLAIGSTRTLQLFGALAPPSPGSGAAIIEFLVEDV